MTCFPDSDDETVREWRNLMKNYSSCNKSLKSVGKKAIKQVNSGIEVSSHLQQKLMTALLWIPSLNLRLKKFIAKLNLNLGDALDALTNEKIKNENLILDAANKKLKSDFRKVKSDNDSLRIKVSEKTEELATEKNRYSTNIQNVDDKHISVNGQLYCLKDELEIAYRRKHQQFSETLKTQNDLVDDLKRQLSGYKTELHNLKIQSKEQDELEKQLGKGEEHDLEIEKLRKQLLHQQDISNQSQQKLELLKTTLYEHDMKFEKLTNDYQNVSSELLRSTTETAKVQRDFEQNSERMRSVVDQLKGRLSKSNEERDLYRSQNDYLQRELVELKRKNAYLEVYNQEDTATHHVPRQDRKSQANEEATHSSVTLSNDDRAGTVRETEESEEDQTYILNSLTRIDKVRKTVEDIGLEVEQFSGVQEDKSFLHLKEMLIRNVLELDNIDTEGHVVIRKERKKVLERAHGLLDRLMERCH